MHADAGPSPRTQVDWQRADALDPASYAHLLRGTTAVVHTLGTLLEDRRYKAALNGGDVGGLLSAALGRVRDGLGGGANPLEEKTPGGYDELNRDAGASFVFSERYHCHTHLVE